MRESRWALVCAGFVLMGLFMKLAVSVLDGAWMINVGWSNSIALYLVSAGVAVGSRVRNRLPFLMGGGLLYLFVLVSIAWLETVGVVRFATYLQL